MIHRFLGKNWYLKKKKQNAAPQARFFFSQITLVQTYRRYRKLKMYRQKQTNFPPPANFPPPSLEHILINTFFNIKKNPYFFGYRTNSPPLIKATKNGWGGGEVGSFLSVVTVFWLPISILAGKKKGRAAGANLF